MATPTAPVTFVAVPTMSGDRHVNTTSVLLYTFKTSNPIDVPRMPEGGWPQGTPRGEIEQYGLEQNEYLRNLALTFRNAGLHETHNFTKPKNPIQILAEQGYHLNDCEVVSDVLTVRAVPQEGRKPAVPEQRKLASIHLPAVSVTRATAMNREGRYLHEVMFMKNGQMHNPSKDILAHIRFEPVEDPDIFSLENPLEKPVEAHSWENGAHITRIDSPEALDMLQKTFLRHMRPHPIIGEPMVIPAADPYAIHRVQTHRTAEAG